MNGMAVPPAGNVRDVAWAERSELDERGGGLRVP
jgi:hypothetical protein